jgi:hypothetical protein
LFRNSTTQQPTGNRQHRQKRATSAAVQRKSSTNIHTSAVPTSLILMIEKPTSSEWDTNEKENIMISQSSILFLEIKRV